MVTTTASRYWWIFLLRGIVALLIGLLALFVPGVAFASLVIFLGAFMFVDGILSIIAGISARKKVSGWEWYIGSGIFGVLIGIITFINPFATAVALVYTAALWAIVVGLAEMAIAFRLRKDLTGEGWYIAGGILTIIFGILILVNPTAGAFTLTMVFGIYAIAAAVMLMSLGFRLKKRNKSTTIPVT
jgi:uncharacterized membrane protein HdeD (DUF308 family)